MDALLTLSRRRWAGCAAALLAMAAAPAAQAIGCEELREQIAGKFRSGGVAQPQLAIVDAAASAPGRVVGSCERGARRIVYTPTRGAPAPRSDGILTECKDGRVLRGGSCRP